MNQNRIKAIVFFIVLAAHHQLAAATDWNQWRGANRDGVAQNSPALISQLPEEGLQPVWVSEPIKSARDGGWGSPVIAEEKVFLFAHLRENLSKLEKAKFPWLPPNKRTGMTDQQYKQYEIDRRNEDEKRSNAYKYREAVYAFDLNTGKTIWKTISNSTYTRFPQSGSASVVDGKLYFLGAGRQVHCIDANNGKPIWKKKIPGDFRDEFYQSSPVVTKNGVIVVAGQMFALNRKTGDLLWTGDKKQIKGTHSSPVIWNHYGVPFLITNVAGGKTLCIQPQTGKVIWTLKSDAGVSTPVVKGDLLLTYGNSRKKGLRCFKMNPTGAELVWKYQGIADKGSSPVVIGENVYVQGGRRVASLKLSTGKANWTGLLDAAKPQYTSLIAADNKIFYASKGVICFHATEEKYTPLYAGVFNKNGLMATETTFRTQLKLEELEKEKGGQLKALKKYQYNIGKYGVLQCASPAIAEGFLVLRMKNKIACFNLKK